MIKYIVRLFSIVAMLLVPISTFGQTTYYYKLTKKIHNGTEYTNTAGGQFISFIDNVCYDSDQYGISVNNGKLEFKQEYSNKSKTYIGNSYFGNTVYRFKLDLSVLNIIVNKDLIYVYKRATPPAGQTTCTLIKSRSSSGGTSSGGTGGYTSPSTNNGGWNNPQSGGTTPSPKWDYVYREESCPECQNSGKCQICKGKGSWTNPYTSTPHQCSACNQSGRCSKCGGKGTITTKKLEKH